MSLMLRAAFSLLVLVSLPAFAKGDPAAGQAKSAICAACHGMDGNSTVPMWPKLAGQHEQYLSRQVGLIKAGARNVPEMVAIVPALTEQDIEDISAYFASQAKGGGVADESLVPLGERIYRAGNADTGVPACMACHGPAGEGNPLAGYPALAGQHATYVAKSLTKFRAGENYGDKDQPSLIMNGSAVGLSDEEIQAVSSYVQGLHMSGE